MDAAVRLAGVTVRREGRVVLENVTAEFLRGAVTAVIGPNGAGKTTLLNAMLGLVPSEGRIELTGEGGRAPRIGYVPQRLDFDRAAPITVLDFMALRAQRLPLWFGIRRQVRRDAEEALDTVRARELAGRPLGRLSGGELQRVLLAHALLRHPEILFLDEPVSGVDIAGEQLFCDLLEAVQRREGGRPLTVVMVSHDMEVVFKHAADVLCLKRTVQFQGPPQRTFTRENLVRAYGNHLGMCRHIVEDGPAMVPILLGAGRGAG